MSEKVSEFFLKNRPLDLDDLSSLNKLQKSALPVKELSLRNLFLKEALKNISEAFLFIDMSGTLLVANDAASKFFSLPPDAAGRKFWDFFEDDYFGFSMRESLKFGLPHRLIYKSHRLLELEISASLLFHGQTDDHGLVLVARDISERLRLQKKAHENDRMKDLGVMSAQVAHEIRNPLGGIRGFASLLFRDLEKEPHLQEMAAAIIDGTKALEKLVAGILHYARPIQLQPESKDLGALIKEVAKFVKVDPAFPPSVKIALHIPNDPILAPVDAAAFKSALLNLIFNAIQAMPNGGEVTLSLIKLEGCCQIGVTDTGIGMDSDTFDHLFSPFFTTKKRGNGLGLVETEKIIKAHRGTIDVRSQPLKGSTFTITLPLKMREYD
jgi:signal transduction histidine kinase